MSPYTTDETVLNLQADARVPCVYGRTSLHKRHKQQHNQLNLILSTGCNQHCLALWPYWQIQVLAENLPVYNTRYIYMCSNTPQCVISIYHVAWMNLPAIANRADMLNFVLPASTFRCEENWPCLQGPCSHGICWCLQIAAYLSVK